MITLVVEAVIAVVVRKMVAVKAKKGTPSLAVEHVSVAKPLLLEPLGDQGSGGGGGGGGGDGGGEGGGGDGPVTATLPTVTVPMDTRRPSVLASSLSKAPFVRRSSKLMPSVALLASPSTYRTARAVEALEMVTRTFASWSPIELDKMADLSSSAVAATRRLLSRRLEVQSPITVTV